MASATFQTTVLGSSNVNELMVFQAFVINDRQYDVEIIWKGTQPLFRARDIGTIIELKDVGSSLRAYDEDEVVLHAIQTPGGIQDVLFLTERGLYRLLMQSRMPVARPFQKWVARVIETIREKGRFELEEAVRNAKEALNDARVEAEEANKRASLLQEQALTTRLEVEAERHNVLTSTHRKDDCVVYFGKIRDEGDNRSLIKIGSTKDLQSRAMALAKEFGSIRIFATFPVALFRQFEEYLQLHPAIVGTVFRKPIHEGRYSNREVFSMTEEEVDHAIAIAKRHAPAFQTQASLDQLVELEVLRYKNNELEAVANSMPPPPHEPYFFVPDSRRFTQSRGRKVQRYSADGLELLETYPGCAEAARDTDLAAPTPAAIKKAAQLKTVYKSFRWAMLDRSLPDDTIQAIGETVVARTNKQGLIAMLNTQQTEIVQVFMDMKAAAADRQLKSLGSISSAISRGKKTDGHYFRMWHDCPTELQVRFKATNTLPNPRIRDNGKPIQQVHAISGEVVRQYSSVSHVQSKHRIARASLRRAIAEGSITKGFMWRYADT